MSAISRNGDDETADVGYENGDIVQPLPSDTELEPPSLGLSVQVVLAVPRTVRLWFVSRT